MTPTVCTVLCWFLFVAVTAAPWALAPRRCIVPDANSPRGTYQNSRISDGPLRTPGSLLLRIPSHHFRHDIGPCRYVTKPCNLGLLATCSGKHAYKKNGNLSAFWSVCKRDESSFYSGFRSAVKPFAIRCCFAVANVLRPCSWCLAGSLPHNLRRLSLSPLSSTGPFSRTSSFHTILGARGRRHGRQPLNNIYIYTYISQSTSSLET